MGGDAKPDGAVERRTPPAARRDLTSGPIARTLLVFALPTLASNILQSLNGSVNAIWVGNFLGENALAATSNANIVFFLLISLMFGFGMAATIIVAQAWGGGDRDRAKRAMGTALGTLTVASIVIAAAGTLATPVILRWMATPAAIVPLAEDYMRMIFLAMPAQFAGMALAMSLRGSGDAATPFFQMLLGVLLDAGLNPVLILGLGPAPKLGIAGSGLATALAGWISLLATIAYVYARRSPLRLQRGEFRYLLPERGLLRLTLSRGIPMGLQMIVLSIGSIAVIGAVNHQGVLTTAAYAVVTQLLSYVQMPAMAIGAATSAMVAQNIGAGLWDRVGRITRSGVLIHLVVTGSLVVAVMLADRAVLGLFIGPDSPAVPIAQHIQRIVTWSFLLFGVAIILFGTVRANGAVWPPLLILAVAMLPIRLGLLYALLPRYGAEAIWWTQPSGTVATLFGALAYYRLGGWRKARLLGAPAEQESARRSAADGEPEGRLNPSAG